MSYYCLLHSLSTTNSDSHNGRQLSEITLDLKTTWNFTSHFENTSTYCDLMEEEYFHFSIFGIEAAP